MCCIQIEIDLNKIESKFPAWVFNADGKVYLDLKEDFTIIQSKTSSELDDLDNIRIDYTIGGNIPATRRNNAILESIRYDNLHKSDYQKAIPIIVYSPTYNQIQNTLQILRYDESANEYEVDFYNAADNWAYQLKNLKLRSLDLPSFTFTKENITANWANFIYLDGTPEPYYFGLVDYGSEDKTGIKRNNFKLSDFRPLFSPLHLLRLAFCNIDYKFYCPALETETFKRYWIYLLNVEFWSYENKGGLYAVSSITRFNPNSQLVYGTDGHYFLNNGRDSIIDFTVVSDPNSRIISKTVLLPFASPNPVSVYENNSSYEQLIKFETRNKILKNSATNASGIFQFEFIYLRINSIDNSSTKLSESFYFDTSSTAAIENSFISEVRLNPNDYVVCYMSLISTIDNPSQTIVFNITESTTKISSSERGISLGDTVAMNQLIDEKYTALDLLKGITHILQGRLSINETDKSISLYTPNDVQFYDEPSRIKGYVEPYQNAVNWANKQVCKTWKREYKNEFDNRYIEIGFKEPTDGYIESIKSRFNGSPVLGVKIDLGANKELNEDTTQNLNPFFEPTVMRDQNLGVYSGGVYCPVMWDNTEGLQSFDIKPRILYAAGLQPFSFNLENENRSAAPIMVSKPEFNFFDPQLIPNASYSDSTHYKGWVHWFWRRRIVQYSEILKEYVTIRLNNLDLINFSFRSLIILQSETAVNYYEVKEIADFDPCKNDNQIECLVSLYDEPEINC